MTIRHRREPPIPQAYYRANELAQRWRVQEALRLGVHEFLLKPTSPAALRARLLSILTKPRAMVRIGQLYVPEPRRLSGANDAMWAA